MDVIIRKGTVHDLAAVYRLVQELAIYEKEPEAVTAVIADYIEDFKAQRFHIMVAESDKVVVGMVLYYYAFSTWKGRMYYLEDFVVQEDFRGKGIGKALFEAFLNDAKAKGAVLVKWQVLDWNSSAIGFYRRYDSIIEKQWWNGKIFFEQVP